jgi:hypothetical protein
MNSWLLKSEKFDGIEQLGGPRLVRMRFFVDKWDFTLPTM